MWQSWDTFTSHPALKVRDNLENSVGEGTKKGLVLGDLCLLERVERLAVLLHII
jgi:hypothetical protein